MSKLLALMLFAFTVGNTAVYAQCTGTPTASPSCGTAQTITSGGSSICETTCSGGAEDAAGSCLYASSECSWYMFTATATDMVLDIDVSATDGCHISSAVYAGGGCGSLTEESCQSGAPLSDLHALTGLTVNDDYYVQVCYPPGGACGMGGVATYCISVDEPDPPCDDCGTPCGTAEGYATAPTTATVVADCRTSPFVPELAASSTNTFCYTFAATSTSVDFNVIITSNCGGGNVTNFSWELDDYPCSGGLLQTGDLSSLTFTGLTIGDAYVFCYTFDVPSTCTHTQHCPYFVGATPLANENLLFEASIINTNDVLLNWNLNDVNQQISIEIEKSYDKKNWSLLTTPKILEGSVYSYIDENVNSGKVFYRLKQYGVDGVGYYSNIETVNVEKLYNISLKPNPVNGNSRLSFNSLKEENVKIKINSITGEELMSVDYLTVKGENVTDLNLEEFNRGVYYITILNNESIKSYKFIKD